MLYSIATSIFYVLKSLLGVKLISFSYLDDSLRSKSALCVDVNDFSISSSFLARQLSSYTESMSQLSFSSPELSKSLSNSHSLYPSSKQFIKYRRASSDFNNIFSFQSNFISTHKPMIFYLFRCLQNLINFSLVYTFHISKLFFCGHHYT